MDFLERKRTKELDLVIERFKQSPRIGNFKFLILIDGPLLATKPSQDGLIEFLRSIDISCNDVKRPFLGTKEYFVHCQADVNMYSCLSFCLLKFRSEFTSLLGSQYKVTILPPSFLLIIKFHMEPTEEHDAVVLNQPEIDDPLSLNSMRKDITDLQKSLQQVNSTLALLLEQVGTDRPRKIPNTNQDNH